MPTCLMATPCLPMMMPFWLSRSTSDDGVDAVQVLLAVVAHLLTRTPMAWGTSSRNDRRIFSRMNSAPPRRWAGRSPCRPGTTTAPRAEGPPPCRRSPERARPSCSKAHDGVPIAEPSGGEALAVELGIVHEVDLGQHEHLLRARARQLRGHPFVPRADRFRRVHEEGDHVHSSSALRAEVFSSSPSASVGLVQPRRVHEDELEALAREHRAEAVARGLRRVRRDGDLLAHDGVHERRLAGVRAADEGDESRSERFAGFHRHPFGSTRSEAPRRAAGTRRAPPRRRRGTRRARRPRAVLRPTGQFVVFGGDEVHHRLDRRVHELAAITDPMHTSTAAQDGPSMRSAEPQRRGDRRHGEVDPHVALRAHRVGDAVPSALERAAQRKAGHATPSPYRRRCERNRPSRTRPRHGRPRPWRKALPRLPSPVLSASPSLEDLGLAPNTRSSVLRRRRCGRSRTGAKDRARAEG